MAGAVKVVHVENLKEEEKARLLKALKDVSDSRARVEAEGEYIREVVKKISEDLKLKKALVNKLAKVYHKQNFDEEVAEHEQFELVYKTVVK
jgi:predicted  nucleic acid-binding Zn-ribbon protein